MRLKEEIRELKRGFGRDLQYVQKQLAAQSKEIVSLRERLRLSEIREAYLCRELSWRKEKAVRPWQKPVVNLETQNH